MDIDRYIKKCTLCREWLDRMQVNKIVDLAKFSSVLHYVLETKFNKQCVIYSVEYGAIEFTVHTIKFRLLWQPQSHVLQLLCKHLEGDKFIESGFNSFDEDNLSELFRAIDLAIHNVTPFDVE